MNQINIREGIVNALVHGALCARDYYFEHKETKAPTCAECIYSNPDITYAEFNFVSRHCIVINIAIVPPFVECSECFKLLSLLRYLRDENCPLCSGILREFLSTINNEELSEIASSREHTTIAIEFTRHTRIP